MGCVILLHIFGKITSIKGSDKVETPAPEDDGSADLWERNSSTQIIETNSRVTTNNKFITKLFTKVNIFDKSCGFSSFSFITIFPHFIPNQIKIFIIINLLTLIKTILVIHLFTNYFGE